MVNKNVPHGQPIKSSPVQKVLYGAVLGSLAYAGWDVAKDVASGGSVAGVAAKLALNGAALAGGYMAADVASGMLHHFADQYASPDSDSKFIRTFAEQSHRHHYFPTKLGNYGPAYWAYPLSLVAWAPLVAGAALGAPAAVTSAAIGLVAGTTHYGNFHNWSHMPDRDVPAIGKALQKSKLAIGKIEHGRHHRLPWNTDYCIVSGLMNKPLDAIEFWPKYEKAVHKLTGIEAEAWSQKDYREYIDGKIDKEEYVSRQRAVIQDFRQNHKERIREKWDIQERKLVYAKPQETSPEPVQIDWSGSKPRHLGIKKITREVARAVGAAGLGATAYAAVTSGSLQGALVAAGVGVAATAAAVTGVDLASGFAHHAGDNYLKPILPHTQWHTELDHAEYCTVGFSNKALDAVGFWPKWERAIHSVTGIEPESWKVPEYKAYCLGEISKEELEAKQLENGVIQK